MLTNTDVKNIIQANLNDDRIYAIQLFLTNLIERKVFGGGVGQYRVKDTNTDSYITSLADFISNIDASKLSIEFCRCGDISAGANTRPVMVYIGNYEVELHDYSSEDIYYLNTFGRNTKIGFLLNYLSDNDTALPLKITDVKLVK